MNASATADVHLVQMWVLPDTNGIDPSYEQRDLNDALAGGGLVPVASGQGHDGAVVDPPARRRAARRPARRRRRGDRARRAARARVRRGRRRARSTARRSRPATRRASPTRARPRSSRAPTGAEVLVWATGVSVVAVDWSGRRTGETPPPLDGRSRRRRAPAPRGRAHPRAAGRRARRPRRPRRPGRRRLRLLLLAPPLVPRRARATADAADLWAAAAVDGERWLRECPPPFWGSTGRPRPGRPGAASAGPRRRIAAVGGIRPKSTFQIGGAGSVGTGSVRGFPALARLRAGGFTIWPFDVAATPPVAVEIYPRALTGPVVKRDLAARRRVPRRALSPGSRRATATLRGRRARTRSTPRCRPW